MEFVTQLTQLNSILLRQLLEMESTFFSNKVHNAVSNNNLRTSIIEFIVESCHFLETLYDPFFRWRTYLCGKDSGSLEVEQSPVSVHPETIPFLYESFETALVDCFPELAHEMLTVFGAVISGRGQYSSKNIHSSNHQNSYNQYLSRRGYNHQNWQYSFYALRFKFLRLLKNLLMLKLCMSKPTL